MTFIQTLPANTLGRDFICGDIHGSYSRVQEFLKFINFDTTVDRLITVGDLIDRGPENERCLSLLYEPWFYSVKGNHEQMMHAYFEDAYLGQYWQQNGGSWGTKYKSEESEAAQFIKSVIQDKIKMLPLLITVEKQDGSKFHVIHAELYPTNGEILTDELLADPVQFYRMATVQSYDGDFVLWGRRIFSSFYKLHLDDRQIKKRAKELQLGNIDKLFNNNLSHIYSGHTIVKQPITVYGQTNLDTMAYGSYGETLYGKLEDPQLWCGLTVVEPNTHKMWLVNNLGVNEVQPVVFNHIEE